MVTSKLLHRDLSGQFLLGQLIVHPQLVSEGGEETKVKGVSRPSQRAGAEQCDWLEESRGRLCHPPTRAAPEMKGPCKARALFPRKAAVPRRMECAADGRDGRSCCTHSNTSLATPPNNVRVMSGGRLLVAPPQTTGSSSRPTCPEL